MNDKTVYLMRGLPACGKSYTARQLAGDTGVVLETDQYFYTEVGEDPAHYDYSHDLLAKARRWNLERFRRAVEEKEPESEWWQEIPVLLKYKEVTREILYQWAERLAEMGRSTRRVPAATIRRWMDKWQHGLTVQDILEYRPRRE